VSVVKFIKSTFTRGSEIRKAFVCKKNASELNLKWKKVVREARLGLRTRELFLPFFVANRITVFPVENFSEHKLPINPYQNALWANGSGKLHAVQEVAYIVPERFCLFMGLRCKSVQCKLDASSFRMNCWSADSRMMHQLSVE